VHAVKTISGKTIHLEPVGGIAGDMFVAAMLDAFPDCREQVLDDIRAVLPPEIGEVRVKRVLKNGILALHFSLDESSPPEVVQEQENGVDSEVTGRGRRYVPVQASNAPFRPAAHHHSCCHAAACDYAGIKKLIEGAKLSGSTATHALAILEILARAESRIHGIPLDKVHFHELASWDSLMDVVAAGSAISAIGEATWTISSLPLGCGLVKTQHGLLPIPAPATARILEGYPWRCDDFPGERVTPTGAAIVRYLVPPGALSVKPAGILAASGYGAGTKDFQGLANVLRVVVFDNTYAESPPPKLAVAVIQFDVDDMSGEEIGVAAERLRQAPGVLDLLLLSAQGKKGRPVTIFHLLTDPDLRERCCERIFQETSTIGLRWSVMNRMVLPRKERRTEEGMRLKDALRPNGDLTTKLESDELDSVADLASRRRIKVVAEDFPND